MGNIVCNDIKKRIKAIPFCIIFCLTVFSTCFAENSDSTVINEIPVPNTVTMVDLGAKKCIPCKMMAPILTELSHEYKGRAAIRFIDVWENPTAGQTFGIRAIPTQIFYDIHGKEISRHEGFLSKEEIVAQLNKLGVK